MWFRELIEIITGEVYVCRYVRDMDNDEGYIVLGHFDLDDNKEYDIAYEQFFDEMVEEVNAYDGVLKILLKE